MPWGLLASQSSWNFEFEVKWKTLSQENRWSGLHAYLYTHSHIHTHFLSHLHSHTYRHTLILTNRHTHTHTHIIYTHSHTFSHTYTYTYSHTLTHTHTFLHTYTHSHTHAHTYHICSGLIASYSVLRYSAFLVFEKDAFENSFGIHFCSSFFQNYKKNCRW